VSETAAGCQRRSEAPAIFNRSWRTMKALAASNIGQYEKAVRALGDYHRAVEMGLSICFRGASNALMTERGGRAGGVLASWCSARDQGLVGRFNDVITDYAASALAKLPGAPRSGRRRARSCAS